MRNEADNPPATMKPPHYLALIASFSIGSAVAVNAARDTPPAPATEQPPAPQPPADTARPPQLTRDEKIRASQKEEPVKAPATEVDFVQKAAQSGNSALKLAKLAEEKAESDSVKELARMIVKDHTAANEHLMKAAKEAKHSIDPAPDHNAEAGVTAV